MKILAVIPARGGSKRLPQKNILDLCGKPLIQWTIDAALDCEEIDTVMVSTDCLNISNISKNCGADVPYLRNEQLSSDTASSLDVVLDVLSYYELKENKKFDVVLLLQPTSPLRTVYDIKNAISLYKDKKATAIISVTECEHSPLWCNTLSENLQFDDFLPKEIKSVRSQDLPIYYRLNGAIYMVNILALKKEKTFTPNNTFTLTMDKFNSIDIDHNIDLLMAKTILKYNNIKISNE